MLHCNIKMLNAEDVQNLESNEGSISPTGYAQKQCGCKQRGTKSGRLGLKVVGES